MLIRYKDIPKQEVDRQGEVHVFCDAENCKAEVKLDVGPQTWQQGDFSVSGEWADTPDGWRTSSQDGNALGGGAFFCPKHKLRIVLPDEVDYSQEPVASSSE